MPRELTIGELSERSGVATSALRFYEREGLISARRTAGNQRRYPTVTLRLVAIIKAGKAAGIPLDEIAATLRTLPDGRAPTKREWERLSRRWRADLDERVATLQALRTRLASCIGCGCLSLTTCDLLNPDDEAARLGPGAHYFRRDSARAVARSTPQS